MKKERKGKIRKGREKKAKIDSKNEWSNKGKFWKKCRQVVARINEDWKCREESEVEEERRREEISWKLLLVEDRWRPEKLEKLAWPLYK